MSEKSDKVLSIAGDIAAAFGGPVGLLIKVASSVPTIMKYAGADDTATKVASDILTLAQNTTGIVDPKEAIASALATSNFNLQIISKQMEWDAMYLADIQSARTRDVAVRQASGGKNYQALSMYVLAVTVVVILTYYVLGSDSLSEFSKGVVTLVLGRFLGYIDSIYNFEYGTTRSSRTQQDTINTLSKSGA